LSTGKNKALEGDSLGSFSFKLLLFIVFCILLFGGLTGENLWRMLWRDSLNLSSKEGGEHFGHKLIKGIFPEEGASEGSREGFGGNSEPLFP
jgi:hypothetical protein